MKGEVMTTTAIEQATTHWTVDPENTSVEFDVKTFWGLTTVHGRFDRFSGSYETGPDGPEIVLIIDADSIDTGNKTRDSHLRSSLFFHVVEHPWIRFGSTHVEDVTDGVLQVAGILETAGHSTLLEFPATVRQVGDELEIEATTTVDQLELGMSRGPLSMIRRPATLHVTARLSRPRSAQAPPSTANTSQLSRMPLSV
jgi:polyisoprenoid-binding protein YceI